MNQQPEDAQVRSRALDPEHSYICVAPAGSGKTELLTQRMLVLLARVKKPEEILAITFTRKAAAEMQERVLGALRAAQGPEPHEAHKRQSWQLAKTALQADAQFGWQLIQCPHRLQVRTFDGLCASLVKALPLQAQMGFGVALSDDPDRLFALAAMNLMSELEKPGTVADSLALLLMHLDNQLPRLIELLVALLKSRAAWLPLIYDPTTELREHLEICLTQVREAHIARVAHLIPVDHQATLLALSAFAARNLPPGSNSCIVHCADLVDLPKGDEEGLRQWQGIVGLLLTNDGSWRQRFTKNEGIPAKAEGVTHNELVAIKARLSSLIDVFKTVEPLREALAEISRLPYARYPDQQWQILQALAQVLPRLVAHLQLVFGSEGELDYTEVSLRADLALGDDQDPTDLALHLDHRVNHILVDEFQDTSTHQLQLVQKLTAGWQPNEGRTLFCVGDAMQSIYAFRNANVGLFLRCLGPSKVAGNEACQNEAGKAAPTASEESWQLGQSNVESYGQLGYLPLVPLRLTTNFRSDASIVEWINKHFEAAFPSAIDLNLGAVPFGKAVAYNPSNGAAVGTQGFLLAGEQIVGQGSANDRAGVIAEGEWLAKTIGQVLAANPIATIAILGRGRKQLNHVLPSLKSAGIGYRAVDLDSLASVAAVQDVWVLTRALLDTNDTIAWLSVLRAPWCGLRLADLLALREVPGISVFSQLTTVIKSNEAGIKIVDSDAMERLTSVFLVLSESLAERSRKSLVDWVKGCWLALGGAEGLGLADHNNVERFFDALAECDETTLIQRPERLQNLLAELYALPDPDTGNQIQVMTMHKSKGLEFDVVFLVGLASATGAPDAPLMRWHEQLFDNDSAGAKGVAHSDRAQASAWLLSPIGERGQDRDSLYDWLGYQQKKREHLEACRLLYVACTRAKKQLYLTAVFYQKAGGEFPAPGKGSLLSHIWPTVEMAFRQTAIKIEAMEHLNHNGGLDTADNLPNLRRLVTPRRYSKKLITMPSTEIYPADLPLTNAATIISTVRQNFVQNNQPINDESDSLARALGSVTHEILEVIVPAEIKTYGEIRTIRKKWSPFFQSWRQRLEQLLQAQSLSAERLSILKENLATQIPVIVNHLDKVFSNQSPLCLALKDAREIHPEFEIYGPDENGDIREWRIDLWWRNNQGQAYLLDYKTALCPQKITIDVFENSQRVLYENGLKRYAKLLSQTLGELVIPVLYLIDTHSWLIIGE